MGQKKATVSKDLIKDCFVREVRVNYLATTTEQFKISGPDDIAVFSRSVLLDNSREQFIAMYLDGAHSLTAYSLISIGSANFTTVHPREVFQRAVLVGAIALVISHNHPSGNDTPSQQDLDITKRLRQCAELLGIKLLDHVIVTNLSHRSLSIENAELWLS